MKRITFIVLMLLVNNFVFAQNTKSALPKNLVGTFTDDYKIEYHISDSVWLQKPNIKYHVLKIDTAKQYILLKNDSQNKFDANLYTRIDYMYFQNMLPFTWGFCLTSYKAKTLEEAEATASADRANPKKGCNGYPFSRMAPITPK